MDRRCSPRTFLRLTPKPCAAPGERERSWSARPRHTSSRGESPPSTRRWERAATPGRRIAFREDRAAAPRSRWRQAWSPWPWEATRAARSASPRASAGRSGASRHTGGSTAPGSSRWLPRSTTQGPWRAPPQTPRCYSACSPTGHLVTARSDPRRRTSTTRAIGLCADLHLVPLTPEVQDAFDAAVDAAVSLGAQLVEVTLPEAAGAYDAFGQVQRCEALRTHTRAGLFPARREEYGSDVRGRLELATKTTLADYLEGTIRREQLRAGFSPGLRRGRSGDHAGDGGAAGADRTGSRDPPRRGDRLQGARDGLHLSPGPGRDYPPARSGRDSTPWACLPRSSSPAQPSASSACSRRRRRCMRRPRGSAAPTGLGGQRRLALRARDGSSGP